jgi:hypothetical protein
MNKNCKQTNYDIWNRLHTYIQGEETRRLLEDLKDDSESIASFALIHLCGMLIMAHLSPKVM